MTALEKSEAPIDVKLPLDFSIMPVKKAKLRCEVWDMKSNPPRFIKAKNVRYGDIKFRIKLGRRTREYRIVYEKNGISLIKQYGKLYLYQTDVHNSLGAISFYPYTLESVNPIEADAMLEDGLGEVFIRKGGMPFWYLLIPIIGLVIMAVVVGITAPQSIQYHDLAQQTINLYNTEHMKVQSLSQQLTASGITPNPNYGQVVSGTVTGAGR